MKKIIAIISFILIVSTLVIFTSCSPDAYIDYHESDIDFFFSGNVPEDAMSTTMVSPLNSILKEYGYINAQYDYFVKNAEVWADEVFGPGDYNLSILSITYEPETYLSVKARFFETVEYVTESPELAYNGYDFYEYHYTDWSPERVWFRFIYHAFNDEKNTIVLLKYKECRRNSEVEQMRYDDFIGFLDKYYGEYYDFHA